MGWRPVSEDDRRIVAWQLGRAPRHLHGVASVCAQGCPRVVVNRPLPSDRTDTAFFPTVFWLTCPETARRISRLEDQGYIQRIQEKIQTHAPLSEQVVEAHQEYIFIRRSLLDPEDLRRLREGSKAMAARLEGLGIGGVADLSGIKCLHMHYAHFLATRHNPIGRFVEQMLTLMFEPEQCRQCRKACQETLPRAGVAE